MERDRAARADAAPGAAALALLAGREGAFRRTARRHSLCASDADDALQRALEILITKAPPGASAGHLAAWMHVVTRREALAVRRERERLLGGRRTAPDADGREPIDLLASDRADPVEHAERNERSRARLAALARLKSDERRAIVLQAQGHSYAEIGAICGWTYTKVNRCLAEGRARLRRLVLSQSRPGSAAR